MLLTNAKAAQERLQSAEATRANLEEARALIGLQKELAAKAAKLHYIVARYQLLREHGVALSPSPDTKTMRKTISNLRARFDEKPSSSTLTQGKHWTGLQAALEGAITTLETQLRQDWKNYFDTRLFAGLPPEQRKIGLVQTPDNILALNQYALLYETFSRHRNAVAETAEELAEVHRCSEALTKITFVEDVPKAVEIFINAVPSGAGLDLLTAEVIEWLQAQGLHGSFVVRARA
jgi:hypothetical protein